MQTLYYNVLEQISLTIATRTSTANGNAVDLLGFNKAYIIVVSGTITDGTHTIGLEESDDGSSWAAVSSSDIIGTLPVIGATDDDKIWAVEYRGRKRYIRVKTTVSGNPSSGGTYGAVVLKIFPRHAPVK